MKSASSLSLLVFVVVLSAGFGIAYALHGASPGWPSYGIGILAFILASLASAAL